MVINTIHEFPKINVCKTYRFCILIEFTFLKELIIITYKCIKSVDICHYWYFLDKGFKFQPDFCNECLDVLMMSINLSDIAVLSISGTCYHCIINRISKIETISLQQNVDLNKKAEHYKT